VVRWPAACQHVGPTSEAAADDRGEVAQWAQPNEASLRCTVKASLASSRDKQSI
jgi:hypothetical protein